MHSSSHPPLASWHGTRAFTCFGAQSNPRCHQTHTTRTSQNAFRADLASEMAHPASTVLREDGGPE